MDGVAGQAITQVGNLVGPESLLTSVSQLNPIKAYFSISDSEYLDLIDQTHTKNGNLLERPFTALPANADTGSHTVFCCGQPRRATLPLSTVR